MRLPPTGFCYLSRQRLRVGLAVTQDRCEFNDPTVSTRGGKNHLHILQQLTAPSAQRLPCASNFRRSVGVLFHRSADRGVIIRLQKGPKLRGCASNRSAHRLPAMRHRLHLALHVHAPVGVLR